MMRSTRNLLLSFAMATLAAGSAAADSAASLNREGNRLFSEGKFREAEKAYGDAQARDPGRPELYYNTGNALLKQKNVDSALQALRQAISRGGRALQARAWYNSGNALYEAGRYRESADAFIQALRSEPADRDAKHNLELALRRLKEQQNQKQSSGTGQGGDQNKEQPQDKPDQKQAGKGPPSKGGQPPPQEPSAGQNKPANPQVTQAEKNEGTYSRERALQILDALQNQELAEQRKLLEQRARRRAAGRDW